MMNPPQPTADVEATVEEATALNELAPLPTFVFIKPAKKAKRTQTMISFLAFLFVWLPSFAPSFASGH
jgi:hypothetical protein